MNTPASREKKLKFIRSFGRKALEESIMAAVYRNGAEYFLTDEQLDEITSEQVRDARSMNQRVIRQRRATEARLAASRSEDALRTIREAEGA